MRDLPILMDVMPPCLCESKVVGYEYNEDGFNVTHCACGGVISCTESEDVEVKKPFDITKHDFSDWEISSADFEYGEFTLRFFEVNAIHLNKQDAIAIAKALGVTGEDLK